MVCRSPCHLDKDESEHGEHRRLDESDEDFEEEKWEWHEIRHEVEHHREEHFPREHIAEQSERKREEFRHFTHHLQESHDRPEDIRFMERTHEKFRRIPTESECRDTRELDREDRNERERDRHIEIRRRTPDERDDGSMTIMHGRPADRSHPREEPHPIRDKNEEKYRSGEGKELPPRLAIPHDIRREVHEGFEYRLHDILKSPRYQLQAPRKKRKRSDEKYADEQCRHHRIRHRKSQPFEIFFRRD